MKASKIYSKRLAPKCFFILHSPPFDFPHNVASERPDKNISSALLAFAFWACLHSTAGPSLMRSLFRPSSTLSEDNGTRGVFLFHQEKVWEIKWSSIQLIFDSHHFTFESHKDFNHFPWVTVLHQYFWNTRWIAFLSWRLPFDICIPWPWQSKMPGIYYDLAAHFCDFEVYWELGQVRTKILDEKWGVGRWGLNWPTQCTDAGKAARGQSQTPTQATHGFAPTLPSIASTLIPKYPTSRRVWIPSCWLYCPILQERSKNTSICIRAPGRLRHPEYLNGESNFPDF